MHDQFALCCAHPVRPSRRVPELLLAPPEVPNLSLGDSRRDPFLRCVSHAPRQRKATTTSNLRLYVFNRARCCQPPRDAPGATNATKQAAWLSNRQRDCCYLLLNCIAPNQSAVINVIQINTLLNTAIGNRRRNNLLVKSYSTGDSLLTLTTFTLISLSCDTVICELRTIGTFPISALLPFSTVFLHCGFSAL